MSKKPDKRSKRNGNWKEDEKRTIIFGRKLVVFSVLAAIFVGFVSYQLFENGLSEANLFSNRSLGAGKISLVETDFSVDTANGKYAFSENRGKTLVYFFSFPG